MEGTIETWELLVFLSWLNADHIRALNGRRGSTAQYIWSLVLILTVWWYQGTCFWGKYSWRWLSQFKAKFQCHLMLVFMNCQGRSVCKSQNETETEMWKKKKWLSALKMSYQTSHSKVGPWKEGLERRWVLKKNGNDGKGEGDAEEIEKIGKEKMKH